LLGKRIGDLLAKRGQRALACGQRARELVLDLLVVGD